MENASLKLSIQKTKIMASGSITSWQIEGGKNGSSDRFYFLELQNHCGQWLQPWNLKTLAPWKESYDKPRQCRYHFASKGPYSQSYGFSSCHVWIWELDHKEGWAPKDWGFQIMVLEKILEESLRQQRDQTSQSSRKSTLNIHWKDWCRSSSSKEQKI